MNPAKNLPTPLGYEYLLDEPAFYQPFDANLNWPKISIVIPSFQQGKFLETTLRSLFLQGYPALEVILIDGGSTDETQTVIHHYQQLISFWVSEPDKGQSHAINKGIDKCTGQIFNWINSDDWLEPGALFHVGKVFLDGQTQALTTRANIIKNGQLDWVNGTCRLHENIWDTASERGLNQQGLFYRMDCIRALKGVDPIYHYSMDLDLWVRFLLTFGQSQVRASEFITANFRFHANSKSEQEGWGPGSASDLETKTMRIRIAQACAPDLVPAMKRAYPDFLPQILSQAPHSSISSSAASAWLSHLLFKQAQKAFFDSDFNTTHDRLSGWWPKHLTKAEQRDFFGYKAAGRPLYIRAYFSILGRMYKAIK